MGGQLAPKRCGHIHQNLHLNKENKEIQILAEAVPRYKKLDFFNDEGIRLKRENYEKPNLSQLSQSQGKSQGKGKEQGEGEKQGLGIR